MKSLNSVKTKNATIEKRAVKLFTYIVLFAMSVFIRITSVSAQAVLFDLDNAPLYTPLPISQTMSGITAHFSATGQGYSIQDANTMGFTPQGFGGFCIYPSSVFLADLLIKFDQTIADFSIMYACQELACDDAATMRVTAYINGSFVGTNTKTATFPGTWPSDTLSCSFTSGFDSVVVHYDSPPPTCQDYGVIFMADNMRVTPLPSAITFPKIIIDNLNISHPASQTICISFFLLKASSIRIVVYDITGKSIDNLFEGYSGAGSHTLNWDLNNSIDNGVYYIKVTCDNSERSRKVVLMK